MKGDGYTFLEWLRHILFEEIIISLVRRGGFYVLSIVIMMSCGAAFQFVLDRTFNDGISDSYAILLSVPIFLAIMFFAGKYLIRLHNGDAQDKGEAWGLVVFLSLMFIGAAWKHYLGIFCIDGTELFTAMFHAPAIAAFIFGMWKALPKTD